MDQLFSAFGIDWKLLIIQALNFGLLLIVLSYFLYKPILKIIDERREKIAEGVRTADAAARRLAEAKEEGDKQIGEAAREAQELVAKARTAGEERKASILGEAEVRAQAILKDAEARVVENERLAFQKSERDIAKAAMLAAEKILREHAAAQK
jgi:F-type H+-transporting ATPase subunit b